ncbi:MAG: DUF47 domain-containing protein [Desulfovibrionaceae bacterium]
MGLSILRRQVKIIKRIDNFLDLVSESGLLFTAGTSAFFDGEVEEFLRKLEQINKVEHLGDELRRDLERQLYLKTLIPESRGDVFDLLENMDQLTDSFKHVLFRFEIERPEIPDIFDKDYKALVATVVASVEAMVLSARAFFNNLPTVSDHMHKVSYWESESDEVTTRLQRAIFRNADLHLSHKNQLRDFAREIDTIANRAEDVADKLTIFVIKRTL